MHSIDDYSQQSELYAQAKADLLAIARGTDPYGIAAYIGERDYLRPDGVVSPEPGKSFHPAVAAAEFALRQRIGRDEADLSEDIKKRRGQLMEV
jgi:hypothetical protein